MLQNLFQLHKRYRQSTVGMWDYLMNKVSFEVPKRVRRGLRKSTRKVPSYNIRRHSSWVSDGQICLKHGVYRRGVQGIMCKKYAVRQGVSLRQVESVGLFQCRNGLTGSAFTVIALVTAHRTVWRACSELRLGDPRSKGSQESSWLVIFASLRFSCPGTGSLIHDPNSFFSYFYLKKTPPNNIF